MARSKWISFGAQQQLQRAAKAATTNATLSLPTSGDAKKFGLENVRIQALRRCLVANLPNFAVREHLVSHYHTAAMRYLTRRLP